MYLSDVAFFFSVSSDEFFSPTAWVEATIGDVDWHWLKTHAFCVEYGLRSAANCMGSLAYLTVTLSAQFCPYTKHLFSAVSPADTTIREHQEDLSVVNVFYVYLSVSLILDVVLIAVACSNFVKAKSESLLPRRKHWLEFQN